MIDDVGKLAAADVRMKVLKCTKICEAFPSCGRFGCPREVLTVLDV